VADEMRALHAQPLHRPVSTASTRRAIDSGPSARCERPLPGRSTRITRCRASAGISGVKVFELPPRPCTQTTASPSPSSSTAMRSNRCSVHASNSVVDGADAVDLDAHASPARSQRGGVKPMPTPAGVPVAMTSPGCSVMPREQVSISVGMSKIMSFVRPSWRSSPLTQPRTRVSRRVEFVGGGDPRAHRAEGVEALAQVPLLVAHLHVARADVVDHGPAEDVVHRARARDVASAAADHHRQLGSRSRSAPRPPRPAAHRVVRADHAVGELGEDDGPGGLQPAGSG
jgi:hypothetical protein